MLHTPAGLSGSCLNVLFPYVAVPMQLLETSGVADVEPLASLLSSSGFKLAGVVAVVDAEAGAVQLQEEEVALAQVRGGGGFQGCRWVSTTVRLGCGLIRCGGFTGQRQQRSLCCPCPAIAAAINQALDQPAVCCMPSPDTVAAKKTPQCTTPACRNTLHPPSCCCVAAPACLLQLRAADVVVLNKCDLASLSGLSSVEDLIQDKAPGVRMMRARYGQVREER